MTLQLPTLLALVGTALLAIAIFAPERATSVATAAQLPSHAAAAVDRRYSPPADAGRDACSASRPPATFAPSWPESIDPRAAGCDATTRIELIGALDEVGTQWAESILRFALEDEPDPRVRAALDRALAPRNAERYALGTA